MLLSIRRNERRVTAARAGHQKAHARQRTKRRNGWGRVQVDVTATAGLSFHLRARRRVCYRSRCKQRPQCENVSAACSCALSMGWMAWRAPLHHTLVPSLSCASAAVRTHSGLADSCAQGSQAVYVRAGKENNCAGWAAKRRSPGRAVCAYGRAVCGEQRRHEQERVNGARAAAHTSRWASSVCAERTAHTQRRTAHSAQHSAHSLPSLHPLKPYSRRTSSTYYIQPTRPTSTLPAADGHPSQLSLRAQSSIAQHSDQSTMSTDVTRCTFACASIT